MTKKLPRCLEDIDKLADGWSVRCERERLEKEAKETQKLEKLLESGKSDTAINAALDIIRKNKPELLRETAE